jgi:hypothetical protein
MQTCLWKEKSREQTVSKNFTKFIIFKQERLFSNLKSYIYKMLKSQGSGLLN